MSTAALLRYRRDTPIAMRLAAWTEEVASGCWEWQGARSNGYGTLYIDHRNRYAHRLSYEDTFGTIPAEFQLDHLCRNRKCVNPDHLEPVTPRVNNLRGVAPGARAVRTNACLRGHDRDTWGVTYGPRVQCRLCRFARQRERSRLRRAGKPLKPINLDAIFRSQHKMARLGLLELVNPTERVAA